MAPIRAVPTKTLITVFIVNSILEAANIFLRNTEYEDCGLRLRKGITGLWPQGDDQLDFASFLLGQGPGL
jgi:hypothetical protein